MKTNDKGKIYLLIGYLGSGKTTFIRNLLQNKQGQKYAVIQNQFAEGQMGIQQPLIMDESGVPFSSFLQLPNGCICCSAKNDLVAGVEYILQNTDVQNIIVETNGLADPAQAIKQFWFDSNLQMNAELHSIITIISVQRFPSLTKQNLFKKQVIYANKVLLTFIDKSTQQQVSSVFHQIKLCNDQCQIAKNNQYNVVEFLAGEDMFSLEKITSYQTEFRDKQLQEHEHEHKHNKQLHKGIHSLSIKSNIKCATKNQFECCVGELLWQSGIKILRIKGIVSLADSQNVYQLQGVDDVFQIKQSKTKKQKVNGQSIVLIIGEQLDEKRIRNILKFQ